MLGRKKGMSKKQIEEVVNELCVNIIGYSKLKKNPLSQTSTIYTHTLDR